MREHFPTAPFRTLTFRLSLLTLTLMLYTSNSRLWAQQLSSLDAKAQETQTVLIKSILNVQAEAWNQGNLEKFMETYWKSDKLTFSGGGTTTRGWQATLDRYKKTYTPEKMGKLHFTELEVTILETKTAMVLGNWHLRQADGSKSNGNFSLVVAQIDGKWKIIHDHSATLKE